MAIPNGKRREGERAFVTRLVELGNERSHIWAGVDYLQGGVPDIDAIFLQEDIGCFNIEVKAVSLDMIEEYRLDICRVKSRSADQHPVKQPGIAQLGLRNYIGSVPSGRCPFLFTTAALPNQVKERFTNARLDLQFEGMLFAEDLKSSSALCRRPVNAEFRRERPPNVFASSFSRICRT